jgi:hypothetical protein
MARPEANPLELRLAELTARIATAESLPLPARITQVHAITLAALSLNGELVRAVNDLRHDLDQVLACLKTLRSPTGPT